MSDETNSAVLLERSGGVCTLTLNRPAKLNAADAAMQRLILQRLQEVGRDPETRALVITGEGRAFCAGADREMLAAAGRGLLSEAEELGRVQHEMARTVLAYPFPAIAAVNGPAAGFGAALAAFCDIIVGDEACLFWDPHVEVGLSASLILQIVWSHQAPISAVKEILMTGRRVDAEEAKSLGLIDHLCPLGQALPAARDIAKRFASLPPEGIAAMKARFNQDLLNQLT